MILDTDNVLCKAAAVGTSTTTGTAIGDVIDQTVSGQDEPGKVYLVISVTTEIITAGSAGVLTFQLASSAAANMGTPTVHLQTPPFVTGATGATTGIEVGDFLFVCGLPASCYIGAGHLATSTYLRYLGILAVITTTALTAGAINAYLTLSPPSWKAKKAGI
ncbi:MAG TPA: hypothetical protein VFE77_03005 [Rhodanobacter sp.]|nr:hypothetical protein [Rhodanobacter sp.]